MVLLAAAATTDDEEQWPSKELNCLIGLTFTILRGIHHCIYPP